MWSCYTPGGTDHRSSARVGPILERAGLRAMRTGGRGGEILRNAGGGERVTKGTDGKIRSKDTIPPARDPNPPRDKEH